MKVFTVGLDDKEKAQKAEAEKADITKIPIDTPSITPASSPIIIPRGPPASKGRGCGVLSWIVAAFFLILLCLTISEIAYNRQRDQAYLRLKWAELRQRMLGYELLSQAQTQNQAQTQPVDERLAFIKHNDVNSRPLKEETSSTQSSVKTIQPSLDREKDIDSRFDFLRTFLNKIRENAESMGLTGDMQVHLIEVKPESNEKKTQISQQAFADGFGEIAAPKQIFGPWPRDEDYHDNHFHQRTFFPQWPSNFERENIRPIPWERSYGPNRFNQWAQEGNQWPQWEDRRFGEDYFDGEESPQMRITHHFDRDNNNPQRIVTELYGDNAPEVLRTILGQDQKSQPNFQQSQWGSDYGRWDGMNQQQPMVYYLPNQFPQQQTFQPSPFQPSIGQQNQFPISFQNQAPIIPQTFFGDNNQMQSQRPWYSTGDDEGWAQTWDNDWHKKVDTPAQPQSAIPSGQSPFRPINWVDNSAAVGSVGKDADGIDGFTKQEKFNVPIDVASDDEPQSVRTPDSSSEFKVNAWQHTQPSPAEETAPAIAPISTDIKVGPAEDKDFLPLRSSEEKVNMPHNDHSGEKVDFTAHSSTDDADFAKKFNSPFFQIDDPSSFRH